MPGNARIFFFPTIEEVNAFLLALDYFNDPAIENVNTIPPEGACKDWSIVFDDKNAKGRNS